MPSLPQVLYAPAPRDRRTLVCPTVRLRRRRAAHSSPALAHTWWARHGPHIASCVEGVPGCYEGPAMLGRLYDHNSPSKAGYEAVPGRESPCQWRLAQVVLGDQGSVAPDCLKKAPVASWVDYRVSIGVQTASRSTPRTSRSPSGETNTCRRSIR